MKKFILILLVYLCLSFSTAYESGFERGYKDGYCYLIENCLEPLAPLAPLPRIGEQANFKNGYNRGFISGRDAKDSE